ncbi:MAG: helix-turn-helix transcriptional regulator [Gammaproteobacteria bacterium]|nr:helix-turn-helix transcriptional regulator [Gammaproteobacteria bacterium]
MKVTSSNLIGNAVRFHRRRGGLSQHALADLAGVGKTSVFDIEKGKSTVRLATLMAVLHVLNIDLVLDSPLMTECSTALTDVRAEPDEDSIR